MIFSIVLPGTFIMSLILDSNILLWWGVGLQMGKREPWIMLFLKTSAHALISSWRVRRRLRVSYSEPSIFFIFICILQQSWTELDSINSLCLSSYSNPSLLTNLVFAKHFSLIAASFRSIFSRRSALLYLRPDRINRSLCMYYSSSNFMIKDRNSIERFA